MPNKKSLWIVLAIVVIVILILVFSTGDSESEVLNTPERQPVVVAREFLNTWHGTGVSEVSAKIGSVKDLVTPEFVRSLDVKLESDSSENIDPVTCLTADSPRFSLVLREKSNEESVVEVRENIPGEDVFTSSVFLVNLGGVWKVRDVSCFAPEEEI